jgi:protein-glutamine gamma-glutamyltransferase
VPIDRRSLKHPPAAADHSERWLPAVTLFLVVLAASSLTLAVANDHGSVFRTAVELVAQAGLTIGAALWFRRQQQAWMDSRVVAPCLLLLGSLTFAVEPVLRVFGTGRALEIIFLDGLRLATLGLGVASSSFRFRRMAVVLSLFLTIFSAAIARDPAVYVLAVIYALTALGWAMGVYWDELRLRLVAQSQRRPPKSWIVVCGLLVVALFLALAGREQSVLHSAWGFLPSSGGTGDDGYDPFARDGVGDGDALIAGAEDVRSFAPIEDAPFLSDDRPSLYDVFDDTYGEPFVPKSQDRSIALRPDEVIQQRCDELAEMKQAGREFSTHRRDTASAPKRPTDRDSDALLYVSGRTPLHLRLETYDLFDGRTWYPEVESDTGALLRIEQAAGRPWLRPSELSRGLEIFRGRDAHHLKVIQLDTNRIPAPLHLNGVHIDRVEAVDFFQSVPGDIIAMTREQLPPLTVIHLASRTLDPAAVVREVPTLSITAERFRSVPATFHMQQVRKLAEEWTRDVPRGWPQVEAVTQRLRADFEHDRSAVPPDDCLFSTGHFLLTSRRGPDYLFATSAALMLRSLGYSTRVVSGFYADPDKYDRRQRHTPVHRDDVHFWVEVYLSARTWATVEPTPGYEILRPPPTFWEQIVSLCGATLRFVREHATLFAGLGALGLAAFLMRYRLFDLAAMLAWSLRRRRQARAVVGDAVRLLDRRCRWAGVPRPPGVTPARWLQQVCAVEDRHAAAELREFLSLGDWAAFAPGESPQTATDPRRICWSVLKNWTYRRLRAAGAT